MTHSNKICKEQKQSKFNSVIIEETDNCVTLHNNGDLSKISKYLLKVGAASALTFSVCNLDQNSYNFNYSESITIQETQKIGINNFLINSPINDDINLDHEIAYQTKELENLNPIPPKKSIKVTGNVIRITKGRISKV